MSNQKVAVSNLAIAGSVAAVVSAKKGGNKQSKIEPGSQAMEQFLSVGYPGMTRQKAELIIKERSENPALWPYEKVEQADAFLQALATTPRAIDKETGFNQPGSEFGWDGQEAEEEV